jgi:mono/diheme cytochrome c family protein
MNLAAIRVTAFALCLGLACAAALAAAPPAGGAGDQQATEPATTKAPERFKFYVRQGIPAQYRGKTNPLATSVPNVIKGADLYNARCASCHGLMGFGNGAAGGGLRPRPADLAWSLSNPQVKDDFLLWTISEGGAQFGTNMPTFKGDLREGQIWEIITYMRAAFEGREAWHRTRPARSSQRAGKLSAVPGG